MFDEESVRTTLAEEYFDCDLDDLEDDVLLLRDEDYGSVSEQTLALVETLEEFAEEWNLGEGTEEGEQWVEDLKELVGSEATVGELFAWLRRRLDDGDSD